MKHIAIRLDTVSPLAIRADHAPGGLATASYIPGSTFLGSLAAAHRIVRGERTPEFEQLFLSGEVLFPNLYPAAFKDEGKDEGKNEDREKVPIPVYPVPVTAQSCKRHGGFFSANLDDEDEHHGVRDTLFDWAVYKTVEDSDPHSLDTEVLKKRLHVIEQHKECEIKTCKAAMDHFDGFYRRGDAEPHRLYSAVIDSHKRLRTHTGINRERGSVEESILYNRQVFEEEMRFWGEVILPDTEPSVDDFSKFITEISSNGLVRIGTGRSRGMGKVTVSAQEIEPGEDSSFAAFKARLQNFNQKLQGYMKEWTKQTPAPFYFAITLHSPLILCDDSLRYYGSVDAETLKYLTGLSSPLNLLYQATSTRRVMGWNELWGMPRGHEYAIDTGSVFLYESKTALDDYNDDTLLALYNLEEAGIGRRRAEGFGRVLFSDPFHLEVNLR